MAKTKVKKKASKKAKRKSAPKVREWFRVLPGTQQILHAHGNDLVISNHGATTVYIQASTGRRRLRP